MRGISNLHSGECCIGGTLRDFAKNPMTTPRELCESRWKLVKMFNHHTKNKGDLGVAKAFCDLVEKGFIVLFPATEHAPFDLAAYKDNRFIRIQVKYRRAVNGSVQIPMKSWWADINGFHGKQIDKTQIDVFCVYCPDTDKCYYFKPETVGKCFTIRIANPKNNQAKGINFAEDYTETP